VTPRHVTASNVQNELRLSQVDVAQLSYQRSDFFLRRSKPHDPRPATHANNKNADCLNHNAKSICFKEIAKLARRLYFQHVLPKTHMPPTASHLQVVL
jgi:hypothetical protein